MKGAGERLKEILDRVGADALYTASRPNLRYLSGAAVSECALISTGAEHFLLADSRYTEAARAESRGTEIVEHDYLEHTRGQAARELANAHGWRRIAFDRAGLMWSEHDGVCRELSDAGIEFFPMPDGELGAFRAVKSAEEIELTERACGIADAALERLLPMFREGESELRMKTELDYIMKCAGADNVSFDTMVLFGERASHPHETSSGSVRLERGDFILIDYGAEVGGYRSDTTRTFVFGEADDRQRAAYASVLKAQEAALAAVAPGRNGREIHEMAASSIESDGFPPFTHGLGHGVGLEIHESPRMRAGVDWTLEAGNIVTVEPGIYIPGWGGIRIEDTALVTESGARRLTMFPKELRVLPA